MDNAGKEAPTLDAAWQAFLDRAVGPGDRYDQIRALGGMARARERWKRESQQNIAKVA